MNMIAKLFESPRRILLMLVFSQFVLHLPFFQLPPVGQHTWRQVIGLSAAKNFYMEDNNILYPRCDTRVFDGDPGHNYQEFPLVYWVIAQTYFLTGFNETNGRLLMLVFNSFLIILMFHLGKTFGFSERMSILMSYFVWGSPLFYYYSINMLPNLPALTMFIGGFLLLTKGIALDQKIFPWFAGTLLVAMAVLQKISYVMYGLPVAWYFIYSLYQSETLNRRKFWFRSLSTACVILAVTFWNYSHSKQLFEAQPVERQVILTLWPTMVNSVWEIWEIFKVAVGKWYLEVVVNIAAVPLFLFGLYLFLKQLMPFLKDRKLNLATGFWGAWLVCFAVFACLFSVLFEDHDYYLTALLPLTAYLSALGAEKFFALGSKYKKAAIFMMALVPIFMVGRVVGRWTENKQIPNELLYESKAITKPILEKERVLVYGDSTPNVYLYYLERKGLKVGRDVSGKNILDLKDRGFSWFIYNSRNPIRQDVLDVLGDESYSVGEFKVFKL